MNSEELYNAIGHIASYSVWLPILAGVLRIKALNSTLWALFIYLLLCFVVDQLYLHLLPDLNAANTVINCWCVVETTLFLIIYYLEAKNKVLKAGLFLGYFAFLVVAITFFGKDPGMEDEIVAPTEAALFILITSIFFIVMLFDNRMDRPLRHYFFWINFALLLYFCASILTFIKNEGLLVWGIHYSIAILCNIFLATGICVKQRRIQSY